MVATVQEIDKKYNVRPFVEAPTSLAKLDTITLDAIDFSFDESKESLPSRQKLAAKLENSLTRIGFTAIINHGIDTETFSHLRSIAQSVCDLPIDVQKQYLAGAWKSDLEDRSKSLGGERGSGFKPRGYWSMQNGVEDSIVHYNFNKMLHKEFFDLSKNKQPELVQAHLPEIQQYFHHIHTSILRKLTILCDLILELPEGYIWENYFKPIEGDFQNSGTGFGRFMKYQKMNPDDQKKVNNNWLRGHSDSGGFTFITSQPILSLQIRDYHTGQWKYVDHIPNAFIVNVGDAFEFITGGYFKSAIHRVVAPPPDQARYTRLVLIYFSGPKNTSILDPEPLNSPKLKRLGIVKPTEWEKITFAQWNDEKATLFGKKKVNDQQGDEPALVLVYGRLHERWHQAEGNFTLEEARKRFKVIEI